MFDYRRELINLAEQCLHTFVEERLSMTKVESSWKNNLPAFVEENYALFPAKYEFLHNFYAYNDAVDLEITTLDITALVPLLLHYPAFEPLRTFRRQKESKLITNRLYDIEDMRNTLKHYPEKVADDKKDRFLWDQVDACSVLIRFCMYAERYVPADETWKKIINEVLYYQGNLSGEKWFVQKGNNDLQPESDISDLMYAVENGDTLAQVIVGKMYMNGSRVRQDPGKAYMWFYKAAKKGNPEAEYYLGRCYTNSLCTDYDSIKADQWMKLSAEHGFAEAQYEMGIQHFAKVNITCEEKEEMIKWFTLSAQQEYPPAIWSLSLCYKIGHGVDKDEELAYKLRKKAAEYGYIMACIDIAKESVQKNDNDTAMYWYRIAAEKGDRQAISLIARYEKKGTF